MKLSPFLLNDWIESRQGMPYSLAGSTGPAWSVSELLQLGDEPFDFTNIRIGYAPPAGTTELRAEIAAHHGVDPDWVVVTNGASEAILLAMSALSRAGANVLFPSPTYPAFAGIATFAHVAPRSYRLSRDRQFRIEPDEVVGQADDFTILAVANSPHNPTGAVLPRADCISLAGQLAAKGIPLLVDEVFHPVYFDAANPTAAGVENVIVIGDMSKAFSLPGLRIGWIIDADADRREQIIRARSYVSLSSSPITEALALHAMRHRAAILERTNAVASMNFASLRQFMDETSDILDWVPPESGMLAFPWFRDGRDSRPFCETMRDLGVLIAPGDCFGIREHMRIGFGSQPDGIGPALGLMAKELQGQAALSLVGFERQVGSHQ